MMKSRLADTNFYACFSRGRIRLHADVIVNRIAKNAACSPSIAPSSELKPGRAGTESDLVHLLLGSSALGQTVTFFSALML